MSSRSPRSSPNSRASEGAHVERSDHLYLSIVNCMPFVRRTVPDLEGSDHRDFESLVALATLAHFELHRLALFERAVAIAFDVREVHEHVGTALSRNEAIALLGVEELHSAGSHCLYSRLLSCQRRAGQWHKDSRNEQRLSTEIATRASTGGRGRRGRREPPVRDRRARSVRRHRWSRAFARGTPCSAGNRQGVAPVESGRGPRDGSRGSRSSTRPPAGTRGGYAVCATARSTPTQFQFEDPAHVRTGSMQHHSLICSGDTEQLTHVGGIDTLDVAQHQHLP